MECINCSTKNTLKERTQNMGQCKKCDHQFVFEPAEMESGAKITDELFAELITEVSAHQTLFFTPIQLYYALEQRLRSRADRNNPIIAYLGWGALVICAMIWIAHWLQLTLDLVVPIVLMPYTLGAIAIVAQFAISPQTNRQVRQNHVITLNRLSIVIFVVGIPLSAISQTLIGMVGATSLGLIAAGLSFSRKGKQPQMFNNFLVDRRDFQTWLNKWIDINDFPEKILASPKISTAQATRNPRVIAYNFDRVVVCDSPKIAQLLLKNNFHFENNCAVVAIDRYPQHIFMSIKEMLDRTSDLQVFAFHDFSPQGLKMIRHLRTEKIWFPDLSIPIIDVGILPLQVRDNSDQIIPQSPKSAQAAQQLSADLRNSLDPTELAWLDAGFYLELEAFPPQKLIQILQRAIRASDRLAEIENGDPIVMNSPGLYTVASLV